MREHIPVMLNEVLAAADVKGGVFTVVDATLGLAGHSAALLEKFPAAFLYGFDQDAEARALAAQRLSVFEGRCEIIGANFRTIGSLAEHGGFDGADMVLFDLGVSNLQITEPERGFSFQSDGPLDMRMNAAEDSARTAADILNCWDIKALTEIFREYGEERYAFQIAKGIVRNREKGVVLRTTGELVELIRDILPAPVQRKMGGHPARRIFQALRIAVNDELNALDEALDGALKILKPGGRIIVISYHSLEDRLVKKRFRQWQDGGCGEPSPRKAVLPSDEEVVSNYKSRSAKMRIFRRFCAESGEKEES